MVEQGIEHIALLEAFNLRQNVRLAQRAVSEAGNLEAEQNLAQSRARRQEFWLDSCREARQMQWDSTQVLQLYRSHGCRFDLPTHQEVQGILDALDSALPFWDRDHADLFYQTLELNFPALVRVRAA